MGTILHGSNGVLPTGPFVVPPCWCSQTFCMEDLFPGPLMGRPHGQGLNHLADDKGYQAHCRSGVQACLLEERVATSNALLQERLPP